jgi:hypothetical protein
MTTTALTKQSEKALAPTRFTGKDSKALLTLEAQAGGRDGLARMLMFLPAPTPAQSDLLALLEMGDERPLIALLREVGLTPASLASSVVLAKTEFEREVAKAAAAEVMPDVVEDLTKHAIDRMRRCPRLCQRTPTGGIKTMVLLGTSEAICPECDGVGETLQSSPHKQYAATFLGKVAQLPEPTGPGVQVNVQNNVSMKTSSGDFMERMAKAAHAVSGRTSIVEAEVVKVTPSTPQES